MAGKKNRLLWPLPQNATHRLPHTNGNPEARIYPIASVEPEEP